MNYGRYSNDPLHSPMFNGNASSMGGNGGPEPNYKGVPQSGRTPNIIKSGGGGGCVTEGPFSEYVLSAASSNIQRFGASKLRTNTTTAWLSASGQLLWLRRFTTFQFPRTRSPTALGRTHAACAATSTATQPWAPQPSSCTVSLPRATTSTHSTTHSWGHRRLRTPHSHGEYVALLLDS